MNFPDDLKYTKNDEWIRVEGDVGTIGITDFAQDQLSDVVYFEVTLEIDQTSEKGEMFGTVESVKAASDLYLPVSGRLIETNEALLETPENINNDPYGKGWMIKIQITDSSELDSLMDAAAYEVNTKERN